MSLSFWRHMMDKRADRKSTLSEHVTGLRAMHKERLLQHHQTGKRPKNMMRRDKVVKPSIWIHTQASMRKLSGMRGVKSANVLASCILEGVVAMWDKTPHTQDLYLKLVDNPFEADGVVFGRPDHPATPQNQVGNPLVSLGEIYMEMRENGMSYGDIVGEIEDLEILMTREESS